MISFKQMLVVQKEKYQNLLEIINNRKIDKLDGHIVIKSNTSSLQYYHIIHKNGNITRNYIPKCEKEFISKLANKSYLPKIKKLVTKRLKQINLILEDYKDNEIDLIYENMNPNRRALFVPIVPTLKQKIKKWKNNVTTKMEFAENTTYYYTNKGEKVKSKTEKIVADKLSALSIEYKYEEPLTIGNYTFYPDLTVINPYTGEKIFWEHFGMMEDSDYVVKFIRKINFYQLNGIELDKNLIVTFESSRVGLDEKVVNHLIQKHFIFNE